MLRLSAPMILMWLRILSHISCHPAFGAEIEPELTAEQLDKIAELQTSLLEDVAIFDDPVTMGVEAKTSSDVAEVRSKLPETAPPTESTAAASGPAANPTAPAKQENLPHYFESPAMEGVLLQHNNVVCYGDKMSSVSHMARSLGAQLSNSKSIAPRKITAKESQKQTAMPSRPQAGSTVPTDDELMSFVEEADPNQLAPVALANPNLPSTESNIPTEEEMLSFFEQHDPAIADALKTTKASVAANKTDDQLAPLKKTVAELIEMATQGKHGTAAVDVKILQQLQGTLDDMTANIAALDDRASANASAVRETPRGPATNAELLSLTALTDTIGHLSALLAKCKQSADADEKSDVKALEEGLTSLVELVAKRKSGDGLSSAASSKPAPTRSAQAEQCQPDPAAEVPVVHITRDADPMNEFTQNDVLFLSSYVSLFLLGLKIPSTGSLHPKFVRHLLLQHDQRFSHSHEFLLLAFNQYQRHKQISMATAKVKSGNPHFANLEETLNDPDILIKLQAAADDPIAPESLQLMNKILPSITVAANINGNDDANDDQKEEVANDVRNKDVVSFMPLLSALFGCNNNTVCLAVRMNQYAMRLIRKV